MLYKIEGVTYVFIGLAVLFFGGWFIKIKISHSPVFDAGDIFLIILGIAMAVLAIVGGIRDFKK
jgi:hypothetical protein